MESEEARIRRQAKARERYYQDREHRKELSRKYYHAHAEKWKEYHKPLREKAKASDDSSPLERAMALFHDPQMAAHLKWLVEHKNHNRKINL